MGFMKLYVGNLPYNISDDQLRDMFAKYGVPDSARVITDRDSGQSKGFGFVEFSDDEKAKQAMALNGTDFGGRSLTVNEARPRNEGSGGGRPRYRGYRSRIHRGTLRFPFFLRRSARRDGRRRLMVGHGDAGDVTTSAAPKERLAHTSPDAFPILLPARVARRFDRTDHRSDEAVPEAKAALERRPAFVNRGLPALDRERLPHRRDLVGRMRVEIVESSAESGVGQGARPTRSSGPSRPAHLKRDEAGRLLHGGLAGEHDGERQRVIHDTARFLADAGDGRSRID